MKRRLFQPMLSLRQSNEKEHEQTVNKKNSSRAENSKKRNKVQ
jgi:hypothetical protein